MELCDVCQRIDIREMLHGASLGHTETDGDQLSDCRYCFLLENGIPHHDTYEALVIASDHGCGFCKLIRHSLIKEYSRRSPAPEGNLQDNAAWLPIPVFLIPANVNAESAHKGEPPKIDVRVGSLSTDFYCTLEAFSARGMFI